MQVITFSKHERCSLSSFVWSMELDIRLFLKWLSRNDGSLTIIKNTDAQIKIFNVQ